MDKDKEMLKILTGFQAVTQSLSESILESSSKYKIVSKDYSEEKKSFDIVYQDVVFFESLLVYESAIKIKQMLDAGQPVNSQSIQKILKLEESYNSFRQEALYFKKQYQKNKQLNENFKMDLNAAKYQNAVSQMKKIKTQLI